jgi:hypothetical protein
MQFGRKLLAIATLCLAAGAASARSYPSRPERNVKLGQ